MKKRIISAICLCMALIITAGCGGNGKPSSASSKKSNTSGSSSSSSISSESADSSGTADNSSVSSSVSSGETTKTIVTPVPKRERTTNSSEEEEIQQSSKFSLENDTTVKYEKKLGKYEYVWGDEFDGTSLDTTKWGYDWRNVSAVPDQYFTEENVVFNGKTVNLIGKRYFDPSNNIYKWSNAPYLCTQYTMNFQHGYLEMRARVPYKTGFWPAIYLLSSEKQCLWDSTEYYQKYGFGIEVDIFEIHGSEDQATPNLHAWIADGSGKHIMAKYKAKYTFDNYKNLCNEFHVYGFEWTETEMSMFVDGEKYNTFYFRDYFNGDKMGGFSVPAYIVIDNGVISPEEKGNDGMGLPRADQDNNPSDFPTEYEVDWVRLYQEPGKGGIVTK